MGLEHAAHPFETKANTKTNANTKANTNTKATTKTNTDTDTRRAGTRTTFQPTHRYIVHNLDKGKHKDKRKRKDKDKHKGNNKDKHRHRHKASGDPNNLLTNAQVHITQSQ